MAVTFTRGFLYRLQFAKSDLEAMRDQVRAQLLSSGPESIMSWGSNGESVSKRPEMTVAEWADEIMYSLALTDPEKYGTRLAADVTTAGFDRRY